MAREGFKGSQKQKTSCSNCKTCAPGNILKCKFCKRTTHETCAKKFLSAESLQSKLKNPGTFRCKDCVIQVTMNVEDDEDEEEELTENEEAKMIEFATLRGVDEMPVEVEIISQVAQEEDSHQGIPQTEYQ